MFSSLTAKSHCSVMQFFPAVFFEKRFMLTALIKKKSFVVVQAFTSFMVVLLSDDIATCLKFYLIATV